MLCFLLSSILFPALPWWINHLAQICNVPLQQYNIPSLLMWCSHPEGTLLNPFRTEGPEWGSRGLFFPFFIKAAPSGILLHPNFFSSG